MPTTLMINEIALVALGGLLAWAAIHDFRTFTIPNWICISVAVLFVAHGLSAPDSINWINSLIAGFVMFVGGLALFGANLMGGGDVKLLAALGLWAGLRFANAVSTRHQPGRRMPSACDRVAPLDDPPDRPEFGGV